MAINEEIRNKLPDGAIILDNPSFDNSIIGITFDGRLIYQYDEMVKELMQDDEIDELEAIEFIDYNTIRALPYMGEKAPLIFGGELY